MTDISAAHDQPLSTLYLAADPASVPTARRHLRDLLRPGYSDDVIECAELVASELLTNAVRAASVLPSGGGWRTVSITVRRTAAGLALEVADPAPAPPRRRDAGPDEENGRGLLLVDAVCKEWGFRTSPAGGKVVWAEIVVG